MIVINEVGTITVTAGQSAQLVPQNPKRIGLIFCSVSNPPVRITTKLNPVANQGLAIGLNNNSIFELTAPQYRDLAQLAWIGNNVGGGVNAIYTVIELIDSELSIETPVGGDLGGRNQADRVSDAADVSSDNGQSADGAGSESAMDFIPDASYQSIFSSFWPGGGTGSMGDVSGGGGSGQDFP